MPTIRSQSPQQSGTVRPADREVERDVVYSTKGGVTLHLDLYFPKVKSEQRRRAGVQFTSTWRRVRGGSKSVGTWLKDVTAEMVARGYVVAAVDYRLVPDAQWPAFIHDVKAAVCGSSGAKAARYNIAPDRMGAWGTSAGGHLVALLGTTDATDKLEGDGGNPEPSSRLQAVVDLFGPTDLTRMRRAPELARQAFGSVENLKLASPVEYVTRDDPPFLIIQGDSDKTVPLEQSEILYERLRTAGAPAKLVVVKGGGHGLTGRDIAPTKAEMVTMIADFFDQHLRKPDPKQAEQREGK